MVNLEIELRGDLPPDEIFRFRDFIKDKLPEITISVKKAEAHEGQMEIPICAAVKILLEASTAVILEKLYLTLFQPLLLNYIHNFSSHLKKRLEIMSTLKNGDEKIHVLEKEDGRQILNYKYEIDPDKTLLMLVGTSEFKSDFPSIPPVKGNIEDLHKLFQDKLHVGIPDENIVISLNEEHTAIQKKLLEVSHRSGINTLIFYFAGHGHRVDVNKLTLITKDSEKIDNDIIGGIDLEFVNSILKRSSAHQKLIILDTCHSGIATQGEDNPAPGVEVKGNIVIASSPAEDVSYFERSLRNTYFTGALLEAMDKGMDNTNDMLAVQDIFDYTKEVFSSKNFPSPQMREDMSIPSSSFYIARNPGFSVDKLKWRAVNMMRDGNLESAMSELRTLAKHYPDDISIHKHYEECETELSFSKILNQANELFYVKKDPAAALPVYQQAIAIKDDPMVRQRIKECEEPKIEKPDTSAAGGITEIESQPEYSSFRKATDRKAWYTGYDYLKKLSIRYPSNKYLQEEMQRLEKKLTSLSGTRDDERLGDFYQTLDKGRHEQALGIIKSIISNDPEDPALQSIERSLSTQIDEQKKEPPLADHKNPTLFRAFKLLSPWVRLFTLILLILAITGVLLLFNYFDEKKETKPATIETQNKDSATTKK
ncbi:MAG: caspase family protein [Chitinophagaceae bacterium]